MVTCYNCGTEVSNLKAFCTNCGAKIELGMKTEAETHETKEVPEAVTESQLKSKLATLRKKSEDFQRQHAEIDLKIQEREKFSASLTTWHQTNTSSFLWRTFSTMKTNLGNTDSILQGYEAIVAGLVIPDPGIMIALRKRFHRRLLAGFTISPALMAFFFWLPTLISNIVGMPGLVQFLTGLLIGTSWIYSIGISGIILTIISSLISYYRGWATYQAKVNKILWEFETVSQNAAHVRSEQLRLKSVYSQLREWLEIMGHSLTNPWKVNEKWFESASANIQQDSLPYSMHIAQTDESYGPSMLGMQRFAAERYMVRGWRSRVFAEQVEVIRQQMGLSVDRLNVDLLDGDIAYAPNGPRAMVRANIADEKILERVAQEQIEPLTIQIQKEAIAQARPPVHEVKSNQIDNLGGETGDSGNKEYAWDEFLSMSLGGTTRLVSPFSLHSLSDSGRVYGHQSRADSFYIAPQRLEAQINSEKSQNVRTYSETSNLPMDIVVRLDFTGPIPDENLSLLASSKKTLETSQEASPVIKDSKPRESGID